MSASLVGSEMCIRDRRVISGQLSEVPCAGHRPVPLVQRHVLTPASADSVSYTHLTLPTICSV
eukprot:8688537-Alexandrium_andersonii.AAC.1